MCLGRFHLCTLTFGFPINPDAQESGVEFQYLRLLPIPGPSNTEVERKTLQVPGDEEGAESSDEKRLKARPFWL